MRISNDHLKALEQNLHRVINSIGDIHRTSKDIEELGLFCEAQYYRRLREYIERQLASCEGIKSTERANDEK